MWLGLRIILLHRSLVSGPVWYASRRPGTALEELDVAFGPLSDPDITRFDPVQSSYTLAV
eukprot:3840943-Prymnesium_polylepis.1